MPARSMSYMKILFMFNSWKLQLYSTLISVKQNAVANCAALLAAVLFTSLIANICS